MAAASNVIVVEYLLEHPILRHALSESPEMQLTWERSDPIDDERIRFLVWADGGDFDSFDAALAADPTVSHPHRCVPVGGRRLYEFDLVGEGRRTSFYPLIVEEGVIVRSLTATRRGWEFRVAVPDFRSVERFRSFCEEMEIGYTVRSIHGEVDVTADLDYGLTDAQREFLLAAVDLGYFEIPRRASLHEVADAVGISGNAASERLRRGMETLVERTIAPPE